MSVSLRPVERSDWQFILDIRNEPDVRNSSFTNEIIDRETHFEYMKKLDLNKDVYQRIISYYNEPVGYVKVIDNDVSYMIRKEFRGRGLSQIFSTLLYNELKEFGIKKVHGSIKIENEKAINLAKKMGYRIINTIYKDNRPYAYYLEKEL
jgi:RimJ/RimL family protein N-acetyltransferase